MQKISSLASKMCHLPPPPMLCEACCISPFQLNWCCRCVLALTDRETSRWTFYCFRGRITFFAIQGERGTGVDREAQKKGATEDLEVESQGADQENIEDDLIAQLRM